MLSFAGHNSIFNWAFQAAEDAVHLAVNTAAPIISKLDSPILYVDQTLCSGIDKLEAKAPIIKEQPQEIYQQARNLVVDRVTPTLNRVCSMRAQGAQTASSLKDLSYKKANAVLATQYGSMAVSGLDTTSALAERLLDYYFPKNENDTEEDNSEYRAVFCFSRICMANDLLVARVAELLIIARKGEFHCLCWLCPLHS